MPRIETNRTSAAATRVEEPAPSAASSPRHSGGGAPPSGDHMPGYDEMIAKAMDSDTSDDIERLRILSTYGQPPVKVDEYVAKKVIHPWDFCNRVMTDILRGCAWRTNDAGQPVRWGVPDEADMSYSYRAFSIIEVFMTEQCVGAGFLEPHAAVSRYPDNQLRVVVHFGEIEVFDAVYRFKHAEIV